MFRIWIVATAVALLAPLEALAQSQRVGTRFPDFTLADIATGKPVTLSQFRGRKVLLIQFASW